MPPVTVNPTDPNQQHGGKPPRQDDLSSIIRTLQDRITALEQNLQGENFVPVGVMSSYGGSSDPVDPDGSVMWMICNGRALSRSAYTSLFTNIGTTYGIGDGSSTFNIPDMRGRLALGLPSGSGPTLGQQGGQLGHNHSVPALSVPGHYHGLGSLSVNGVGDHAHGLASVPSSNAGGWSIGAAAGGTFDVLAMSSAFAAYFFIASATGNAGAHSHGLSGAAGNVGGVSGDSAMSTNSSSTGSSDPPYLTVTYVIKVI